MTLHVASERFLTVAQVQEEGCGCVASMTDDDILALIDAASDAIAIVSGGAISGRQTVRARPCRRSDGWCDCSCGCSADVIPLGDEEPDEIVVKINGTQLPSEQLWLHRDNLGWVIARIHADGQRLASWPSSQKRFLPDTADDTFSITWTQGIFLEQHIIELAALEVVCDFAQDSALMEDILDGVVSATLGDAQVTIDPNRLAEAGDTRLNRIANGELGPMTRRMMGILRPQGRSGSTVWAPELLQGWDLHLELVTP